MEVFKPSLFIAIILPIIISALLLIIFFNVEDIPTWVLFFLVVPVVFFFDGQRRKLIVENDLLRYQHGFVGGDEVSLSKVSQIITRRIETVDSDGDRSSKKIAYVLDESGRTYFSFPADLIRRRNKHRFEVAVTPVNPKIEVL